MMRCFMYFWTDFDQVIMMFDITCIWEEYLKLFIKSVIWICKLSLTEYTSKKKGIMKYSRIEFLLYTKMAKNCWNMRLLFDFILNLKFIMLFLWRRFIIDLDFRKDSDEFDWFIYLIWKNWENVIDESFK